MPHHSALAQTFHLSLDNKCNFFKRYILAFYVCVCSHICVGVCRGQKRAVETLELELQEGCEPPDRDAENLGSLQKQEVLITTKPSLQRLSAVF